MKKKYPIKILGGLILGEYIYWYTPIATPLVWYYWLLEDLCSRPTAAKGSVWWLVCRNSWCKCLQL